MFLDFLPRFKSVEINDSVGYRNGHFVSQAPAATAASGKLAYVTNNGHYFIENGIVMVLGADGTLQNYDRTTCAGLQPFLHYTEELNTVLNALDMFAVDGGTGTDVVYPRGLALYTNDSFTTDNFKLAADVEYEDAVAATITGGYITLQDAVDTNTMFLVKQSTMPNGNAAVQCIVYRV